MYSLEFMMPCLPRSLWGKEKPTTSKIHHNMWQWVWGLFLYGFQATFCSCEKRTFLVLSDHIILYHCNYLSNYKGFVHDWQQSLSFLAAPQKPCGGWHFCWLSDTKTQLTSTIHQWVSLDILSPVEPLSWQCF